MRSFGQIREIDITNNQSWNNKIFITLDIDWAHDDVIRYCADLLSRNNVQATWFVTHHSPAIDELKRNPLFELGIHPNFNPLLLNGSHEKGCTAENVLQSILKIVPGASSVRSHSLTQNSSLTQLFLENNIKKELNVFVPIQSGIIVKPFLHFEGIVELPHVWEDDIHMRYEVGYDVILNSILGYQGLTILDFHPIHLYLNQTTFTGYEAAKKDAHDLSKLSTHRNVSCFGTSDFLLSLIKSNRSEGQSPQP
jgi:hypothetical protein